MKNQEKLLEFLDSFDYVLDNRPGMLGSVSDISAKFFVVDNVRSIVSSGKELPSGLQWYDFLIEKKLIRDLQPIPIVDNWGYERFVHLRHEYLEWVKNRRLKDS